MKDGDSRLQEVLRKIEKSTTKDPMKYGDLKLRSYERLETFVSGDLIKDGDLMLQEVLRKLEAYILGDMMEHLELVLQEVLWKTVYFCYRVS